MKNRFTSSPHSPRSARSFLRTLVFLSSVIPAILLFVAFSSYAMLSSLDIRIPFHGASLSAPARLLGASALSKISAVPSYVEDAMSRTSSRESSREEKEMTAQLAAAAFNMDMYRERLQSKSTPPIGKALGVLSSSFSKTYQKFGATLSRIMHTDSPEEKIAEMPVIYEEEPLPIPQDTVDSQTVKKPIPTATIKTPPSSEKPPVSGGVERVIIQTVAPDNLDKKLEQLANSLKSEIYRVSAQSSSGISSNFQAISLAQKIDNLEGVALKDTTFSGSVSGLTNEHIPDDITASNYLPLTGGTLTNTLTAYGVVTVPYFVATSTSATSTFAGGLAIETSGFIYDFQTNRVGIGTASPSNTLTVAGNADFTGNVGIGTTSPYAALSVAGASGVVANLFNATSTTADSTFIRLTATNATSTSFFATTASSTNFIARNATTTNLEIENLLRVTNASATSTFAGGLAIETSGFVYDFQTNRVGIGTASPSNTLTVSGSTDITGSLGIGTSSPWGLLSVEMTTSNPSFVVSNNGSSTPAFVIGGVNQDGRVGLGTSNPATRLDIFDTSAQLRLSQTSSVYSTFSVAAATGDMTLSLFPSSTGNDFIFNNPSGTTGANLWACQGDACPTLSALTNGGNVVAENAFYLGNGYKIDQVSGTTTEIGVYDTAGAAILIFDEFH